jgi:hypothetical protein
VRCENVPDGAVWKTISADTTEPSLFLPRGCHLSGCVDTDAGTVSGCYVAPCLNSPDGALVQSITCTWTRCR